MLYYSDRYKIALGTFCDDVQFTYLGGGGFKWSKATLLRRSINCSPLYNMHKYIVLTYMELMSGLY